MNEISEPQAGEYGAYYENYISLVRGENVFKFLDQQIPEIKFLFYQLGEEKSNLGYAEGKWSAKEVLGHIIDTDRIMAYRALCIVRGDKTSLPGYDQDAYVKNGNFNQLSIEDLLGEFEVSRKGIISLLKNTSASTYRNIGNANNVEVSVRGLFYIIAGHTVHHLNILKERYLSL
jgi:hypothetical protein